MEDSINTADLLPKEITPFHQRLIAEKDELDEKIKKLQSFLESSVFGAIEPAQQVLLRVQVKAMDTYSQILTERLSLLQ